VTQGFLVEIDKYNKRIKIVTKIFLTLVVVILSSLPWSAVSAATFGQNLIVNPGAEEGEGDPIGNAVGDDIPIIPGWNPTENFSVLRYGATGFEFVNLRGETVRVSGLPELTSPGPDNRGQNLFYGGGDRGSTSASQLIDVSNLASSIDAAESTFTLSGWLGGYTENRDNASLEISFLSQNNQSLGEATIASPTPEQRNNTTGLFFQSVDGLVPTGTRQINVALNMNYVSGRVNDAYADNLSLVLTQVPEPSTSALLLLGISSVMVWRLRRNRRLLH
jgi:hypothetical protein